MWSGRDSHYWAQVTQPWAALHFLASSEARKCSAAQGPHSEVVPRAFWRLVSKSCDECKGSFAGGCEAKRWSHWTCSSLGTIFQPVRINSVPDVKCFYNNKNVLRAQSVVWHFVHHPVFGAHVFVVYIIWFSFVAIAKHAAVWFRFTFPYITTKYLMLLSDVERCPEPVFFTYLICFFEKCSQKMSRY